MQSANRGNAISRSSYFALGGCLNSSLTKCRWGTDSTDCYETYHFIGHGTASFKQDLPKGPPLKI